MITRALLLFLLLVFLGALGRLLWLRYRPPPRQMLLATMVALALLAVLALVATGRLHWLAALVATVLPFAARILGTFGLMRLLGRLGGGGPQPFPPGGGGGGSQQASTVETRFLRMELDHASGELHGDILDGPQAGRTLADLTISEQLELFAHYQRSDPDSARLLETWLDRTHGAAWREQTGEADRGGMSRSEALDILGLTGQPGRDEIIRAHRRMMQKFHPDHGGSDTLAARINEAKERLLADL